MLWPMTGRLWPDVGLIGVLAATALYCAARLLVARWRDPGTSCYADLTHLAMAVAMIAMQAGVASALWGGAVLVGSVVATVWAGGRLTQELVSGARNRFGAGRALGHAHVAVASAAMLYLAASSAVADPSRSGGHHHGVAIAPLIGVVVAVLLAALVVSSVGGLAAASVPAGSGGSASGAGVPAFGWPRRLTLCCHTAMGVAMVAMVVAML